MKMFLVQPRQNKFTAYHFDGTKDSASSVVEKWGCVMSVVKDELYKLTLIDGRDVMPNDYIVVDNGVNKIYKQEEFIRKYDIVYDSHRYENRNGFSSFMSDD